MAWLMQHGLMDEMAAWRGMARPIGHDCWGTSVNRCKILDPAGLDTTRLSWWPPRRRRYEILMELFFLIFSLRMWSKFILMRVDALSVLENLLCYGLIINKTFRGMWPVLWWFLWEIYNPTWILSNLKSNSLIQLATKCSIKIKFNNILLECCIFHLV